jgi:hypothetical protein
MAAERETTLPPEVEQADDQTAEVILDAAEVLAGEAEESQALEATRLVSRLFGTDPQDATRKANRLIAKVGYLDQEAQDVQALVAQEMARLESYREAELGRIARKRDGAVMALRIYATDFCHDTKRTITLPAGTIKRRAAGPPTIKLADDEDLLEFVRRQPYTVYDDLVETTEKLKRKELRKRLSVNEDTGEVLWDGEEVFALVDETPETGPVPKKLAWRESRVESFIVEPAAFRPVETGGEVVITRHARERFAQRGPEDGGDLETLADDARQMCRRAGTTECVYAGLAWCFAVSRGAWTLVTVKPGPTNEESE